MVIDEFRNHLCERLLPFWKKLRDLEHGGYYGWMDSGLEVDREAGKGCILNSRILWFFSNAYLCLQSAQAGAGESEKEETGRESAADSLGEYADWAYRFLKDKCMDSERGGVYWSLDYRGQPEDTTKHTYNQAFAVYALSSYFRAYHDRGALALAESLIEVIETKCFDGQGYKEALDIEFRPVANDKLSENGVMADRTMNTLLHILEAYTEYLLACRELERLGGSAVERGDESWEEKEPGEKEPEEKEPGGKEPEEKAPGEKEPGEKEPEEKEPEEKEPEEKEPEEKSRAETAHSGETGPAVGTKEGIVTEKLHWILNLVAEHVYNPALHRQEVFFDLNMESLIDLHSYGHDIEAAWLMDRCLEALGEEGLTEKMSPILRSLENEVYEKAYNNHSLANECERGTVDEKRVWWVQAEGVVGFYNAYQKTGESRYLEAAEDIWGFIQEYLVDKRPEGEWFWYTDASGLPALEKPIVEPWKCPYHNGRMCMEIMKREKRD